MKDGLCLLTKHPLLVSRARFDILLFSLDVPYQSIVSKIFEPGALLSYFGYFSEL